jgi:hypothetical protein
MRRVLTGLVLAVALVASGAAFAGGEAEGQGAAKKHWLGKAEVEAKVSAQGYTVKKVKNGVGRYEVKAKGKDGKTVVLYVSPWTGEIVGQESKKEGR